ncbi:MAG TPA: hypothetical protein VGP33_17100 [Chloroflexota bacterium]|jgi:hypothetical protein|nr:hypothetical protein [Chloroflexota bacterium]
MFWRLLVFRIARHRRLAVRAAMLLLGIGIAAVLIGWAAGNRQYRLTVLVQPPFVGEGIQIYAVGGRLVTTQAGDRRTFIFVLPRDDYTVGGMLAQNGESRPLPTPLVPVHLDQDRTITLFGGG